MPCCVERVRKVSDRLGVQARRTRAATPAASAPAAGPRSPSTFASGTRSHRSPPTQTMLQCVAISGGTTRAQAASTPSTNSPTRLALAAWPARPVRRNATPSCTADGAHRCCVSSDNIYDMCGGDGLAAAQGEPRADGAAGVYAPMNDRAKTALEGIWERQAAVEGRDEAGLDDHNNGYVSPADAAPASASPHPAAAAGRAGSTIFRAARKPA